METRIGGRNPSYTDLLCSARINSALRIVTEELVYELLVVPALISQFLSPEMIGIRGNAADLLTKTINRAMAHLGILGSLLGLDLSVYTLYLPATPKLGF